MVLKRVNQGFLLFLFCLFIYAGTARAENISIEYNIYPMSDTEQTGWLKAYDENDNQLWYYQCGIYTKTELESIFYIGVNDGLVYIEEQGTIIALDLKTGYEQWRNSEFQGSTSAYVFSSSGKLYICGYYGPDFFVVDKNGKTCGRVDQFNPNIYWPYRMEFTTGNNMEITYANPEGTTYEFDVTQYTN